MSKITINLYKFGVYFTRANAVKSHDKSTILGIIFHFVVVCTSIERQFKKVPPVLHLNEHPISIKTITTNFNFLSFLLPFIN